jgi:peptide deformylase
MGIITDINVLRKKNEPVKIDEVAELVSMLEQELASSFTPGVGLAAPQIGINKTIAIVRLKTDEYEENYNLVNPFIIDRQQGFINRNEGCLSLPGKAINTRRYKEILVKDDFHPAGFVVIGFPAVVVQHEIDHLEGMLIIDRAVGKDKVGRNDLCPCGSGKKYKKCHGR